MLYQYGAHNCSRTATIEEGGKWWCKQHVPSIVAARREKRNSEWEKKWAADRAAADHRAAITAADRAVVEAAVRWRLDSIHPSVKLIVNETPMLNATQEDADLVAAVDALIAAREGR